MKKKSEQTDTPAKPAPPTWDAIEQAQAKNMLRKIQSGKVLTTAETDFLRNAIASEVTPTAGKGKPAWLTLSEIATMIGRNPSSLSRTCAKHGVRPRARDGKYNLADVQAAMVQAAAANSCTDSGADTPRNRKTLLECKILQAKLDQINRNVLTMDEHKADVQVLCKMFVAAFDEALKSLESITRDGALFRAVQHAFGACRNRLADAVMALKDDAAPPPAAPSNEPAAPAAAHQPPATENNLVNKNTRGREPLC